MLIAALLLLQATAAPSPEASALALRLARTGTLSALLPTIATKETEEMVAAHPELTPDEQAKLRATAKSRFDAEVTRIDAAFARAYASRLSVDELRALVAQAESAPAERLRAVQPSVMAEAVSAMGQMDFKGETLAAFCRDTGKACAK